MACPCCGGGEPPADCCVEPDGGAPIGGGWDFAVSCYVGTPGYNDNILLPSGLGSPSISLPYTDVTSVNAVPVTISSSGGTPTSEQIATTWSNEMETAGTDIIVVQSAGYPSITVDFGTGHNVCAVGFSVGANNYGTFPAVYEIWDDLGNYLASSGASLNNGPYSGDCTGDGFIARVPPGRSIVKMKFQMTGPDGITNPAGIAIGPIALCSTGSGSMMAMRSSAPNAKLNQSNNFSKPKIALDCVHLDAGVQTNINPQFPARGYRQCEAGHGLKCGCEPGQKCSPQECPDYEKDVV